MKQNSMFNALFETYFDWSKIKVKKNVFLPIWPSKFKMADKVEKSFEKMLKLKNYANRFQYSIACWNGISIALDC